MNIDNDLTSSGYIFSGFYSASTEIIDSDVSAGSYIIPTEGELPFTDLLSRKTEGISWQAPLSSPIQGSSTSEAGFLPLPDETNVGDCQMEACDNLSTRQDDLSQRLLSEDVDRPYEMTQDDGMDLDLLDEYLFGDSDELLLSPPVQHSCPSEAGFLTPFLLDPIISEDSGMEACGILNTYQYGLSQPSSKKRERLTMDEGYQSNANLIEKTADSVFTEPDGQAEIRGNDLVTPPLQEVVNENALLAMQSVAEEGGRNKNKGLLELGGRPYEAIQDETIFGRIPACGNSLFNERDQANDTAELQSKLTIAIERGNKAEIQVVDLKAQLAEIQRRCENLSDEHQNLILDSEVKYFGLCGECQFYEENNKRLIKELESLKKKHLLTNEQAWEQRRHLYFMKNKLIIELESECLSYKQNNERLENELGCLKVLLDKERGKQHWRLRRNIGGLERRCSQEGNRYDMLEKHYKQQKSINHDLEKKYQDVEKRNEMLKKHCKQQKSINDEIEKEYQGEEKRNETLNKDCENQLFIRNELKMKSRVLTQQNEKLRKFFNDQLRKHGELKKKCQFMGQKNKRMKRGCETQKRISDELSKKYRCMLYKKNEQFKKNANYVSTYVSTLKKRCHDTMYLNKELIKQCEIQNHNNAVLKLELKNVRKKQACKLLENTGQKVKQVRNAEGCLQLTY